MKKDSLRLITVLGKGKHIAEKIYCTQEEAATSFQQKTTRTVPKDILELDTNKNVVN